MSIKIGINGFGAIGRRAARIIMGDRGLELVAVNDLSDPALMAHLYTWDSTYGRADQDATVADGGLNIGGRRVRIFSEPAPEKIPWREVGADVVLECTGRFTKGGDAERHLTGGAGRVIVSAPAEGEDFTLVVGVNDGAFDPDKHRVVSNGSCTTNCLAPLVKVLEEQFGIEAAQMTTVHSYTRDQSILDGPHKDLRRARGAAVNIIPTTSGADKAISKVFPHLKGRIRGMAFRVPTSTVSVVDLSCQLKADADAETLKAAFRTAAEGPLGRVLDYIEGPLVSSDLKGSPASATVDGLLTSAVGRLAKVVAWYDNEWGYASRLVDAARLVGGA